MADGEIFITTTIGVATPRAVSSRLTAPWLTPA